MHAEQFDVVVVGGGAAGVSAAIAAARQGKRVVLVEAGPAVGGELVSGLPIDSCVNPRGEWIVGGVPRELFAACDALGGYLGPVFDWRTMYAVCIDPELFRLAIMQQLTAAGVTLRMYTSVYDVVTDRAGHVSGVLALSRGTRVMISGDAFIDCSGDAAVAALAGAPVQHGDDSGTVQPVSLAFRIGNVDYRDYLTFARDHPEEFLLAENPVIGKTPAQCAQAAYDSGFPHLALSADGPLLSGAIDRGEMFPTTFVFTWPTSTLRKEVGLNTTRLAGVDGTDAAALSAAMTTLGEQVLLCQSFCRDQLPGFGDSYLTAVAPRVGIRETRRIVGEYTLTKDDVLTARKREDGIAKGSHHVDIHGAGTAQLRIPIQNGGSYDVPFGSLVPQNLGNVLVAGRCLSSTREANGSARVMGTCLGTGQAAGIAAAMLSERTATVGGSRDVREVPVDELRERLRAAGAVLDGTA